MNIFSFQRQRNLNSRANELNITIGDRNYFISKDLALNKSKLISKLYYQQNEPDNININFLNNNNEFQMIANLLNYSIITFNRWNYSYIYEVANFFEIDELKIAIQKYFEFLQYIDELMNQSNQLSKLSLVENTLLELTEETFLNTLDYIKGFITNNDIAIIAKLIFNLALSRYLNQPSYIKLIIELDKFNPKICQHFVNNAISSFNSCQKTDFILIQKLNFLFFYLIIFGKATSLLIFHNPIFRNHIFWRTFFILSSFISIFKESSFFTLNEVNESLYCKEDDEVLLCKCIDIFLYQYFQNEERESSEFSLLLNSIKLKNESDLTIILNHIQNIKSYSNKGSILYFIHEDDVDKFQSFLNKMNLPIDNPIKVSCYDINCYENISLIDYASLVGSIKCFKFLFMNNALITPRTLNYAIISENTEIIHLIDRKLRKNNKSIRYLSMLSTAIDFHSPDIFEWLILPDENKIESYTNNNFVFCANKCVDELSFSILEKILIYGIDPNGNSNDPLLIKVLNTNNVKLLDFFLSNKYVDPNFSDKNGHTILHHACFLQKKKPLKILLDNPKINKNATDKVQYLSLTSFLYFS